MKLISPVFVLLFVLLIAGCSIFRLSHSNINDPLFPGQKNTTNIQPDAGLVAFYPFNGNAADALGNVSQDGWVAGATLTNNRFNQANNAYYFDGTSYITFSVTTSTNNVYSWLFWSKDVSTNISNKRWLCTSTGSGFSGLVVIGENVYLGGSITLVMGTQTDSSLGASGWKDGNWHMHVITSDGTNTSYYYDMELFSFIAHCEFPESGLYAGGFNVVGGGEFFTGMIDDIRIFNKALTGNEITNYYHENGW